MFRFSLFTLLAAVLAVGLGCAALLNPTPVFEKIFFNGTLAMLALASLAALYLPRLSRAFYGGFAISGWMYLAIVTLPLSIETDFTLGVPPQSIKDRLLTTECLRLLDPILEKPEPAPSVPKQIRIGVTRTGDAIYSRNPDYYYPAQSSIDRSAFYNIGQLLFVILLGVAGGALAQTWQKVAGTDDKSRPEPKRN